MNNKGYLLLPRSICDQPWYRRPTCRLLAYHLLQEASYKAIEHPVLGDLPAGSYVTSTRGLAEELGVSHQEIRTALSALIESEFLTVESFRVGRYGGLKIVIIWTDFTSLRDGDIMLNNTLSNTLSNTATDEVSNSYKGVEVEANTLSNTLTNTASINKDKLRLINTHTKGNNNPGKNKNAHTREAHTHDAPMSAEAQALSEWITTNAPELMQMEVPLTAQDMQELATAHNPQLLRTAIKQCISKRAYSVHRFARIAVDGFAEQAYTQKQHGKLYTYDEFCDQVTRYGRKSEDFVMVKQNGRNMWQRIS